MVYIQYMFILEFLCLYLGYPAVAAIPPPPFFYLFIFYKFPQTKCKILSDKTQLKMSNSSSEKKGIKTSIHLLVLPPLDPI